MTCNSIPSIVQSLSERVTLRTSSNEVVIKYRRWVVSTVCDLKFIMADIAEFTTLKQTWQQSKSDTYLAKQGQTIVPGFTGEYHK
jgi:hypothetical protein